MTTALRASLLAGAAALLLGGVPAHAADATQAQASQVEAQIRTWLTGLLGPSIPVPARPVVLTPAGDHYDAVVRFRAAGPNQTEITTTATAQPLDGGRWNITGIKTTNPVRFTIDMPFPADDPAKPDATINVPVTYTIDTTGQEGTILYDPTFATPSTTTSSIKGATVTTTGAPMSSMARIGPASSVATMRPAGPDRVDIAIDGTMQDYQTSTGTPDTGPVEIGFKLVRVNMGMTGISRTRSTVLVQTLATAIGQILAAPSGTPPKVAPELSKQLLVALQDIASEMTLDEDFEGFTVKAADMNAQLARAKIGFDAKSDAGLLQARMDLGADGLVLPDMGLGAAMDLVPKRVSLRPFVSGVSIAALTRIVQSMDEKNDPAPQDIAALFSKGGIVTGLESMSLEMGGATIAGQGKMTFTNPQKFTGAGQFTADNFDALVEKISNVPEAAQAVPVLAMVKGLGRTVDKKLVWNISYDGSKLLVNNVDLMKAMGGDPGPRPRR